MNTHMWHAGTGNNTDRCRRALHGFYTRSDKPQQQYQKVLLRPQDDRGALARAAQSFSPLMIPKTTASARKTTRMSGFLKDETRAV
jgi:hypothetical protein